MPKKKRRERLGVATPWFCAEETCREFLNAKSIPPVAAQSLASADIEVRSAAGLCLAGRFGSGVRAQHLHPPDELFIYRNAGLPYSKTLRPPVSTNQGVGQLWTP